MKTLTMKFGGTSLGNASAIARAADICLKERGSWDQLLVVVSAMSGVTDQLLQGARQAQSNGTAGLIRRELYQRHAEVVKQLVRDKVRATKLLDEVDQVLAEFETACRRLEGRVGADAATLDVIASIGERSSARLLAAVLQERGIPSRVVEASELIVTDDRFQNAAPDMPGTKQRVKQNLLPALKKGAVPVVPGFIGATEQGKITTLGRGGSDFSASILGASINTDELWIWTDVSGVLTADPRIVANARVIERLSYSEVAELAYFGAKVLHPKTIQPLAERGTTIRVRNTFDPEQPGTRLTKDPNGQKGSIKAVTAIQDVSMVTVEGRGMIGVPGVAARTFLAVAREGVSVLMISQASSEQSISFLVPKDTADRVKLAVEQEMQSELDRKDIDSVWSLDDLVIVTAVGAGLRDTPGIAARIFGALGDADINVFAIAQGSSECSLSLVVGSREGQKSVELIHDAVVNDD